MIDGARAWLYASAAVLLVSIPQNTAAQSFQDVLSSLYDSNPSLESARHGERAAKAARGQGRAGLLPTLSFVGAVGVQREDIARPGFFGGVQEEREDTEPSSLGVEVNQSIFTSGRSAGRLRAGRAVHAAAQQNSRLVEQEVLLAAVRAYLDVQLTRKVHELQQENSALLQQYVSDVRERVRLGDATRTDLAQAEARFASAQVDVARAQSSLEGARAVYHQIFGDQHIPAEDPPLPPVPATIDEASSSALQHPIVRIAQEELNALAAQVMVERAALLPQVSLFVRYEDTKDVEALNTEVVRSSATIQVRMPLFEGGFAWSRLSESRYREKQARSEVQAARRSVESNLATAWANWIGARQVVEGSVVQAERATQALDGARKEQAYGLRSTIEVLNAHQEHFVAQIGLAQAQSSEIFAAFTLVAAAGALNAQTLGLTPGGGP